MALLAITHLGAAAAGHFYRPADPTINPEITESGQFQTDTTTVITTTVESLKDENRLLVFSYKGTARVRIDRTWMWLFGAHQELSVPAAVSYYIDLSHLSLADVRFDANSKIVTVRLPQLTIGDIAFQPENAMTINGGLLSFSEQQVEELRKANYATARRAMVEQARGAGLASAARKQAQTDITNYFKIPLRITGHPDVRVVTTF